MSVPKNLRGHSKLEAILKAQELYKHTLIVTSNEKKFGVNFIALTQSIVRHAESIYINCYNANETYVTNTETFRSRDTYQYYAILDCQDMLALIDLAYSVFKLRGKKVEY